MTKVTDLGVGKILMPYIKWNNGKGPYSTKKEYGPECLFRPMNSQIHFIRFTYKCRKMDWFVTGIKRNLDDPE